MLSPSVGWFDQHDVAAGFDWVSLARTLDLHSVLNESRHFESR